jgi:dihydroorotase
MALRKAVTSGDPWFFLGTDSAPHTIKDKETNCGCAGIFSAPSALELYATVFEEEGAIEKFENFASIYGPAYYGLETNAGTVTLTREEYMVPEYVTVSNGTEIKPFLAGKVLGWRLKDKP